MQHGFIGLNIFSYWYIPYTNATEDVIATQRANDFFIGWLVTNPFTHVNTLHYCALNFFPLFWMLRNEDCMQEADLCFFLCQNAISGF